MLMLIKLAWRNGLRNKRRTFLAGTAIGIGLAALIFADGLMLGMGENMIKAATDTFLGQAQITHEGFTDTFEVEKTIIDGATILKDLEKDSSVKSFSPRILVQGMITSPSNSDAVLLYGISPDSEKKISKIYKAIKDGDYLIEDDQQKVLIGQDLAETLDVEVGSLLVITVAQYGTGDLSQAMFRVGGIYSFNIREMDGSMAFIHLAKAQQMLNLEDKIHEIAVNFTDLRLADDEALPFWGNFSKNGNEARSWREIMPELEAALEMTSFGIFIIGIILFAVVSLGIMNTLFMSLYERMFEFGVLRAIGTRPPRMAMMIIFEAAILAVISIIIGSAIGLGVSLYFSNNGFDYSGIEFAGVTLNDPLAPVMKAYQYYKYPALLFVFTIIVGIYPAIYAARLNPVEAMRKSL